MKARRIALLMCFVALFAISAYAEEVEAAKKSPVRFLTSDPMLVLSVPDARELAIACTTTGIGKSLSAPGMWDLVEFTRTMLATMPDMNYMSIENTVLAACRLFTGGANLALYYPEEGDAYAVLVFDSAGGEEKFVRTVTDMFRKFDIPIGAPKEIAGQKVYSISTQFHFFYTEGCAVLINDTDRVPLVVEAAKGDGFYGSKLDMQIAAEMLPNTLFSIYTDLRGFNQRFTVLENEDEELIEFGGLNKVAGIIQSASIVQGRFRERTIVLRDGEPNGIFAIFGDGAVNKRLETVPERAFGYISQSIDFGKLHDFALKNEMLFDMNNDLEDVLKSFRDNYGIDLPEIIGRCASKDFLAYFEFPPNGFIPNYVFDLHLTDEALAAETLRILQEKEPEIVRRSEWRDNLFYWMPPNDFMPFTLGFMTHKGSFTVSNGPVGLKNLLGAKIGDKNLGALSVYKELFSQLPDNGIANMFVNLKLIGEKFVPMMSFIQMMIPEAHNLVLPIWEDLEPYFSGCAATMTRRGNDFVVDSFGDLPLLTVQMVILSSIMLVCTAADSPFEIMLVPPGKENSAERLMKIYPLLKVYADNHDNNFPPALDDIAKGMELALFQAPEQRSDVDPADIDGTSDYFYFKKLRFGMDMLLMVNRMPIRTNFRYGIFCDGTVRALTDAELIELVKKYNEATGGDIAVEDGFVF